jgi:putative copper export protein
MFVSLEAPIFRFALFCALVLLVGGAAFTRFLEPAGGTDLEGRATRTARLFTWLHRLGAFGVIAVSLLDIGFTARRALGELSPYLYTAYLTRTWNGQWVMLRLAVVVALVWLGVRPRAEWQSTLPRAAPWLERGVFVLLCLVVAVTVSMTSHAGARGEIMPILSDLVHLLAMLAWVGAVLFTSLYAFQQPRTGVNVLERVSNVALVAVGVIALSGVFSSLVRLWHPALLTITSYGQAWVFKIALVAATLALAGINRFVWMPRLRRQPNRLPGFQRFMRVEVVMLALILAATGALTSTAPPERGAGLKASVGFKQSVGGYTLEGVADPTPLGGARLAFAVTGAGDAPLPDGTRTEVVFDMSSHGMGPLTLGVRPLGAGRFEAEGFFGQTGDFDAVIKIPQATWRVVMPSR